ncbi:hypothetical protein IE53DRAFT_342786 [Violaceomyces palustris]|uniref:Uncharacterized protein n=1 Tax=Violaceomyces palustris TaxID=1673888 RepID=A0ACD0NZC2_9BASI|nr:hypothetical protein IE53DRAFT_342786 [Violaceomyces palustris]
MSNVLVYSGPGVSSSALHHTIKTLKLLLPFYDVQTISSKSLAIDPWESNTSLLVLPGGRDLPFIQEFSRRHSVPSSTSDFDSSSPTSTSSSKEIIQRADQKIRSYVEEKGGSFWAICAGAYYSSGFCSFEEGKEIEVVGERGYLNFFKGPCKGTVYPGFVYESDAGSRIIELTLEKVETEGQDEKDALGHGCGPGQRLWTTHYNGGGAFLDAEKFSDETHKVQVLARYPKDDDTLSKSNGGEYLGQPAALLCQVGKGKAALFGTHPEFPLSPDSRSVKLSQGEGSEKLADEELWESEKRRIRLLSDLFVKLGLKVELPPGVGEEDGERPSEGEKNPSAASSKETVSERVPPKLSPLVLMASKPSQITRILEALDGCSQSQSLVHISEVKTSSPDQPTHRIEQDSFEAHRLLSVKDSNDIFHFYAGGNRQFDRKIFDVCFKADYRPFSVPVQVAGERVSERQGGEGEEEMEEREVDLHAVPKYVLVYPGSPNAAQGSLASLEDFVPEKSLTPHFNVSEYLKCLQESEERLEGCQREWGKDASSIFGSGIGGMSLTEGVPIGQVVLYGENVTSTQTMLDKNYKVTSRLPTGLTSIATHQISGRGRGSNAWISPLGCLQFSTLLSLPASSAASTVFVQYIAGLAIVEAIREGLGEEYRVIGEKIRIKWPNDVYAEVDDGEDQGAEQAGGGEGAEQPERKGTFRMGGKTYAKMAGVLVNSSFSGKQFSLVVGCGINCLNERPTTSLSEVIKQHNAKLKRKEGERVADEDPRILEIVSQERLAGAILSTLGRMWKSFCEAGYSFLPFVDSYRKVWLHSDQITRLDHFQPPLQVKIVGISLDYGLLRVVELDERGQVVGGGEISSKDPKAWSVSDSSKGTRSKSLGVRSRFGNGGLSGWEGDDVWRGDVGGSRGEVEFIELQPDGNSFDMLKNLVRRKA